jgi:hypothetical protein
VTPPQPEPPCWHDIDVALVLLDRRDADAIAARVKPDDQVSAFLARYAARLEVLRRHVDAMPEKPLDADPAAALL